MHDAHVLEALEPFVDEGWINEIMYEVKSGKEATVWCCRGGVLAKGELVAAKIYRAIETRGFRNDAAYQDGRMARNSRQRRAFRNRSSFGLQVQYACWIDHEWETLCTLARDGLPVPDPLTTGERALLMPFLGDEDGPAPMLAEVDLDRAEVVRVTDSILSDIERMLDLHRVHGDLSAYNILYWQDEPVIIDFPQSIDPRLNREARAILTRDITNICQWARRHGVDRPAERLASRLWQQFVLGEIG